MTAAALANALGGTRAGQGWLALCPAHADRTPSLSISEGDDGRALVRCHAGCEQAAVLNVLRNRGLWKGDGIPIELTAEQLAAAHQRAAAREREEAAKRERAIAIWQGGGPVLNTPAERYLRRRGINPDLLLYPDSETTRHNVTTRRPGVWTEYRAGWPETLRWCTDAVQIPGQPARPALVAAVNDAKTGLVVAVQRILFDNSGEPLLRNSKKVKVALGPISGNAYRGSCWPDEEGRWGIAEGVESALAATQIFRMPVWAAINAGNMPNVVPPSWAREVTIFADNDASGTGTKAAEDAKQRFLSLGATNVSIWMHHTVGWDIADYLEQELPYA
jgi:hypothetical protein